jgi:hypothetical protein
MQTMLFAHCCTTCSMFIAFERALALTLSYACYTHHLCVLADALMCWGLGESGRLGHGDEQSIGDNEVYMRL